MSVLIDRLQLRKDLCEILKSDYVALLGQRGSGSKTLVNLIIRNESPLAGMKFIAVALPQAEQNSDRFMEIFLNNLINASTQIPPQAELVKKVRQTVQQEAASPIISRVRSVLDVLEKTCATNYLVIVLHALADVSEQPLKDLLLLLREYHKQIGILNLGGEKLRFLVVGSARLWNLCCHKPSDSESPFNIAKRVFLRGLSYQEVQRKFKELGIEQAVKLTDLVDGVPSLVELISKETEDFEDLSSCFDPLEDSWNSLSFPAQQALINLVELAQKFPSCKLDNQCPHIAKFEDSTIWQKAFWRGFLKLRHRKLTWRSPVHQAFVITQAQIETDMSKSTLLRNSLLERVESLEETLKGLMNARTLAECTEELVSLAVHSGNAELVPLLEMMLERKPRSTIFVELKKIPVNSPKQGIRDLTKLTTQPQASFNKLLIEAVLVRVAHDIRMEKDQQTIIVSHDGSTIPYNSKQELPEDQEAILENMNLSGQQRKKLTDALLDAFPDKASLEQMLLFELDKSLDIIAGGSNLQDIVFNLIKTSKAENWIEDLINAALNSNPGNQLLKDVANKVLPNQSPMKYQDFKILVSENKRIRASSEQGEVSSELLLDMDRINRTLKLIQQNQTDADLLKVLGNELYQALFPNQINARFHATMAGARNVRLRLVFESPELATLPWEFLYDKETNTFLGNNTQTVLSRYIDVPLQQRDIKAASLPLKVLLVISSPINLTRLDVAEEECLIRELCLVAF